MAYSAQALTNMITNQLEPSGVRSEAVISAIKAVDRDAFVPSGLKASAYLDEDIPLGHGRFLSEPRVFANMLQYANINEGDKVLDIACGTGYSSAVISKLTKSVVAVESVGELAEIARKNLRSNKADVDLFCASIVGGYTLKAPYDIILINGAVEYVPEEIFDQLADGGMLLAVQADKQVSLNKVSEAGKAISWTRNGDNIQSTVLFDASMPILSDFKCKQRFDF